MLKNIFARVWALWGMISFIATFLIFFLPSMISWLMPAYSGQRFFIVIARIWMNIWLRLVGCPLSVKGRENFAKDESYVVCFNHNSLMDVPLSAPFVPGANKTIAKSSFTKVPLFGWFYMKGSVIVNRKSEKSRKESFDKMKQVLARGMHMCIYPEGTRNRTTDPLKKFHDGAFRLAATTGKSVVPTLIFNTKKVLPIDKPFYFLPHRLHMHFLPPVPVDGLTTEQLRDKVFAVMNDYYKEHSPKL